MKYKSEFTPQTIQEFQAIDKKALIKRKKAEIKKSRLREARAIYEVERAEYLFELAHLHWYSKKDLEDPNLVSALLEVDKRKQMVTRSHIKGSKPHPLILSHRKKGYAAKLRKKFNSI